MRHAYEFTASNPARDGTQSATSGGRAQEAGQGLFTDEALEGKPRPNTVTLSVQLTNFIRPEETSLFESTAFVTGLRPFRPSPWAWAKVTATRRVPAPGRLRRWSEPGDEERAEAHFV